MLTVYFKYCFFFAFRSLRIYNHMTGIVDNSFCLKFTKWKMVDLVYQFLLVVVLFSTLIYMYFYFAYQYWRYRGFPYLEPKFPWGNRENIWELSRTFSLETMSYYDKIQEKSWKFAGIYTILRPVLVILDPDYIRDILAQVCKFLWELVIRLSIEVIHFNKLFSFEVLLRFLQSEEN